MIYIYIYWLVVLTILKKYEFVNGFRMTSHIWNGKKKTNVWNHQAVYVWDVARHGPMVWHTGYSKRFPKWPKLSLLFDLDTYGYLTYKKWRNCKWNQIISDDLPDLPIKHDDFHSNVFWMIYQFNFAQTGTGWLKLGVSHWPPGCI